MNNTLPPLTATQYRILRRLDRKKAVSGSDLRKSLGIKNGTKDVVAFHQNATRFESSGWITRAAYKREDGYYETWYTLTAKGSQALKQTKQFYVTT